MSSPSRIRRRTRAAAARGRPAPRPGAIPALPAALLAALLVGACTDRTERLEHAPEVLFRTLTGERLPLAETGGPTLVSFWSTSCGVCLEEMPELAALHRDYVGRGFTLVAVAMPGDRPDAVLELAERRALPFPVALDIDGRVLAAFEPIVGTPTSFLIDAEGRIVERRVGALDVEAVRARLEEMLGAAAADV